MNNPRKYEFNDLEKLIYENIDTLEKSLEYARKTTYELENSFIWDIWDDVEKNEMEKYVQEYLRLWYPS